MIILAVHVLYPGVPGHCSLVDTKNRAEFTTKNGTKEKRIDGEISVHTVHVQDSIFGDTDRHTEEISP